MSRASGSRSASSWWTCADRADDRFKGYSLGMKQRLGIAAALLKNPRLLILDEPSNGLDPAGIREVRELIQRLGRERRTTVFLSSHLLAEVQQVCDHVTILARGRCVATGPVREVLAGKATGDIRLRVPDPVGAKSVLDAAGFSVTGMGDAWRVHGVTDPSTVHARAGRPRPLPHRALPDRGRPRERVPRAHPGAVMTTTPTVLEPEDVADPAEPAPLGRGSLFRAEAHRFSSRRFIRWLAAAVGRRLPHRHAAHRRHAVLQAHRQRARRRPNARATR